MGAAEFTFVDRRSVVINSYAHFIVQQIAVRAFVNFKTSIQKEIFALSREVFYGMMCFVMKQFHVAFQVFVQWLRVNLESVA